MEKRRVVITGLGTVNPLGNTAADSWAAAKAGRCGIGPITQFDTTDFKCKLAGEVKNFDPETVVDKKEARKMARFTLLALAAAAEAIADSGLNTEAEAKNIGVVLSSGIGGLPTIEEQHTRGEEKGMEKVSPYFVPMSIANMAAAQVAIRFGLKGMCTCPVTACAGGTNAVGDAFHRIRDGYETAMVCGGAESCISPLGIGGFTSMKALSTATDPDAASLPFDARRGGFVMGEGSGVLVNWDGKIVGVIQSECEVNAQKNTIQAYSISDMKAVIEHLSNNQDMVYMGIVGADVTTSISESENIPIGVYVAEVSMDSPAIAAGIQPGDIITGMSGQSVTNMKDVMSVLLTCIDGQKVQVTFERSSKSGYQELETTVELKIYE